MAPDVDYFANHRLKLRLPWRLYHAPIVAAAARAVGAPGVTEVLNVGSGPFFERSHLPAPQARYTICDVDPRALDLARRLHGPGLQAADRVFEGAPLPYPANRFDLVLAMDVIEHVVEPRPWLEELLRVLRPAGALLLTTPNYGSRTLGLLERTALELVARLQGFTRRGLHPSPFTRPQLEALLDDVGAQDVGVDTLSFGWVLLARARKRAAR